MIFWISFGFKRLPKSEKRFEQAVSSFDRTVERLIRASQKSS